MPNPPALPPLPTFLIIGAQRCATRWLRLNLDKHPEIYAPPTELNFFNDEDRFAEWKVTGYRRKFNEWHDEPITGESSPNYLLFNELPLQTSRRIQKVVPDVRLVAIVRNPIDRMESAQRFHIKSGTLQIDDDPARFFAENKELYRELSIISGGLYANCLSSYVQRFGDQLKVVVFDDIEADPAGVYRDVLAHLGASTDFVPRGIERPMFSTARTVRLERLPDEMRRQVYRWYRRDVEQLEEMIGRDLSAWNPGRVTEA